MYKKIDLYLNNNYLCSTNQAKTCKEAKLKYIERYENDCKSNKLEIRDINKLIKAYFAK